MAGITKTGGRLNAFRILRACTPATFTLASTPNSRSVIAGSTAAFAVAVSPQSGFTGSVNLKVSGLPLVLRRILVRIPWQSVARLRRLPHSISSSLPLPRRVSTT